MRSSVCVWEREVRDEGWGVVRERVVEYCGREERSSWRGRIEVRSNVGKRGEKYRCVRIFISDLLPLSVLMTWHWCWYCCCSCDYVVVSSLLFIVRGHIDYIILTKWGRYYWHLKFRMSLTEHNNCFDNVSYHKKQSTTVGVATVVLWFSW